MFSGRQICFQHLKQLGIPTEGWAGPNNLCFQIKHFFGYLVTWTLSIVCVLTGIHHWPSSEWLDFKRRPRVGSNRQEPNNQTPRRQRGHWFLSQISEILSTCCWFLGKPSHRAWLRYFKSKCRSGKHLSGGDTPCSLLIPHPFPSPPPHFSSPFCSIHLRIGSPEPFEDCLKFISEDKCKNDVLCFLGDVA